MPIAVPTLPFGARSTIQATVWPQIPVVSPDSNMNNANVKNDVDVKIIIAMPAADSRPSMTGILLPTLSVICPAIIVVTRVPPAVRLSARPSPLGVRSRLSYANIGITVSLRPVQVKASAKLAKPTNMIDLSFRR